MGKKWRTFVAAAFVLAGLLAVRPETTQAANPQSVTLNKNVTYSQYDITGDGKADTILLANTFSGDQGTVNIYINGALCHSYTDEELGVDHGTLCTLKGTPFLCVSPVGFNEWGRDGGIFQYRSGKLVKVLDFFKQFPNLVNAETVKSSGNKLTVEYKVMSSTFGMHRCTFDYVCKNGTLKRAGSVGDVTWYRTTDNSQALRVRKSITACKSPRTGKKALVLKENSEIIPEKVYNGKYGNWTKVKYKNRHVWIKWNDSVPLYGTQVFYNVFFAG